MFVLPGMSVTTPVLATSRPPSADDRAMAQLLRLRGAFALAGLTALCAGAGWMWMRGSSATSRYSENPRVQTEKRPIPSDSKAVEQQEPYREIDRQLIHSLRAADPEAFNVAVDPSQIDVKTLPGIEEAIQEILQKSDSQILAIGENHRLGAYRGQMPWLLFAQYILPMLAERGYKSLVLEMLPHGYDGLTFKDRQITDLIAARRKRNPRDAMALEKIMADCFLYDISVYGGGLSEQEITEFNKRLKQNDPGDDFSDVYLLVREYSLGALRRLAETGKKIIFYGGKAHVPPYPALLGEGRIFDSSFGPTLQKDYTYSALQLQLPSFMVAAILSQADPQGQIDRTLSQPLWFLDRHGFIPEAGKVNLLKIDGGKGRLYHLVFPFER